MRCRFYISKRLNDGFVNIEARVNFNGVKYTAFLSGVKLPEKYWDTKSHRVRSNRAFPQSRAINTLLDTIAKEVETAFYDCLAERKNSNELRQTIKEAVERYTGKKKDRKQITFQEAFQRFLEFKEKEAKTISLGGYHSLSSHLFGGKRTQGFERIWGRVIRFTDIDQRFADKLKAFMEEKGKAPATMKSIYKRLNEFIAWCIEPPRKYLPGEAALLFSAKGFNVLNQPFSLLESEFQRLAEADLSHESVFFHRLEASLKGGQNVYQVRDHLENTRNLILFMIVTAQRPGDVLDLQGNGLKWSDLSHQEGVLVWEFVQSKTQKAVIRLPIEGWARYALEAQAKFSFQEGNVFDPLPYNVYYKHIKELLFLLDFDRSIKRIKSIGGKRETVSKPLYDFFTLKHCRSTAATFYSGISNMMARNFTGHTTDKILSQHYQARDFQEMRKAAQNIGENAPATDSETLKKRLGN